MCLSEYEYFFMSNLTSIEEKILKVMYFYLFNIESRCLEGRGLNQAIKL